MFQARDVFCSRTDFSIDAVASTYSHIPLVLVADDDEDNLVLMSYALELMGFVFLAAKSGQEVITLSAQHSFSLILLDILLPDINGIDVFKQLRQNLATQRIPVIAVTALAATDDRDRILRAGFTDYLLKPYMLDDLSDLVRKYI